MIPLLERAVWSLKQQRLLTPWFESIGWGGPSYYENLRQRPTPTSCPILPRANTPTVWCLKASHLQVIVRMEEITVSASQPISAGRDGDRLGVVSDDIAAVGLYCYGAENVGAASLDFTCTADFHPADHSHFPSDPKSIAGLYGIEADHAYLISNVVMNVGQLALRDGRMVVWPIGYSAKLGDVVWRDTTGNGQSGSLKLVWFYLVAPGALMLSTAAVPPLQNTWSVRSTDELATKFQLPESVVELIRAFGNPHCPVE